MASISVLDAFESAKREFLSKYPDRHTYDFNAFQTIDHVYQAAQQIQEQQAKSRTMRNLNKIRPLLETLRHYGSVVETFVQVKPDVLALIWISSTVDSIYDKIIDTMEQIGISLPAFQKYIQLFPQNNKMHQVLCLFYQDILDFYSSILEVFKHNKWSTLFKSLWPRYLGRIQVIQRNMSQHRSLMNDEATLAHLVQAEKDRNRDLEEYERQFDFRQFQEFEMVRNSLNARLYDQDLEFLKRRASHGSGGWLEEDNAYKQWINFQDKSSRLLWLRGIPGAGQGNSNFF
ncbi:hypothetical protein BFJ72_g13955 [Fusarium proliferatum]|uniref:Uncharacterized protein n=1 Tax=Gibberella intermedia TaxID=948311 RepID=A0A420S994_GIBIN|nr:hypothetical protein BFJ72_g13955 [Fusarium proliferatum]